MKTFVPQLNHWETVSDFLKDAFELVYDIDPIIEIMILKASISSGHHCKMFVNGDLICTIIFYDAEGYQINSISWQGTSHVEHLRMEDLEQSLERILTNLSTGKQKRISL